MQKARILLFLGIWIAILPYLGFPYSWKNILLTITGLGIVYISYTLYRNYKIQENQEKTFDNFSENNDFERNKESENTDQQY
jgi:hypothetical protein